MGAFGVLGGTAGPSSSLHFLNRLPVFQPSSRLPGKLVQQNNEHIPVTTTNGGIAWGSAQRSGTSKHLQCDK